MSVNLWVVEEVKLPPARAIMRSFLGGAIPNATAKWIRSEQEQQASWA